MTKSKVSISVLSWVPEAGRGLVRDLPVRWALEEAGIPYSVRKLAWGAERPVEYFAEHPFGQVPAYRDDEVSLFESGAIVLHIGENCEALLPHDPQERARAVSWVFSALSDVETNAWPLAALNILFGGQAWTAEARPKFEDSTRMRLQRIADHLGEREWLEGRFTAGDLMMVCALRRLHRSGLVGEHANLVAYQARGESRPAFLRALADHLADFEEQPVAV